MTKDELMKFLEPFTGEIEIVIKHSYCDYPQYLPPESLSYKLENGVGEVVVEVKG